MSEPFDPYLQWLGIRDQGRPPDYYRLLGVELFEDDPDVLTNAADRQMAHVRTFQTGRHSSESQKILNQLAAAKICLLNAEKKARYDAQLLAGQQPAGPVEMAIPPQAAVKRETPDAREPVTEERPSTVSIAIAVLVASVTVLFGLIVLVTSHPPKEDQGEPRAATTGPQAQPEEDTAPDSSVEPDSQAKPELPSKPQPELEPGPEPEDEGPSEKRSHGTQPVGLGKDIGDSRIGSEPQPRAEPEHLPPATESIESVRAARSRRDVAAAQQPKTAKLVVPDEIARTEALKEIRDVFKKDYSQAEQPRQKQQLAETLFSQGLETKDNPAARYVLLSEARDVATDAGDPALFAKAIRAIDAYYRIDPLVMATESMKRASKKSRPPEANRSLARAAMNMAAQAISRNDFDSAAGLAEAATTMARKVRDTATLKQAVQVGQLVKTTRQEFKHFQEAAKVLAGNPDDPHANLAQGRYYCFILNDFNRGAPLLAKGSNATLKGLAEAEMKRPDTPDEMSELGDRWWDAIRTADEPTRPHVRNRAVYWYRKALPDLKGLSRTRLQRRLNEIGEAGSGRRK